MAHFPYVYICNVSCLLTAAGILHSLTLNMIRGVIVHGVYGVHGDKARKRVEIMGQHFLAS